jgi:hypothetical protein
MLHSTWLWVGKAHAQVHRASDPIDTCMLLLLKPKQCSVAC